MNIGTAFVTGANKGIGFATAKALLQQGFRVVIGARDEKRGQEAVKTLSQFGNVSLCIIDVSDIQSVGCAAAQIKENFPDLSVLINNAGIAGDRSKAAWDYEPEELEEVYRVNFLGAYELTRKLLPLIDQNNGKILSLLIPLEARDFFHPFAYQAGKAPLNVLIDNFAFEIRKNNMVSQMIGVKPGTVSTDLNDNKQGKFVKTPDQAAEMIMSVIMSEKNLNGIVVQ